MNTRPLCILAAIALAACGGEEGAPDQAPSPVSDVEPAASPSPPAAATEERPTEAPTFVCHTVKHRVEILAGDRPARYRSWSQGSPPDAAPDLELGEGLATVEGSGPCRMTVWSFVSGDVTFEVSRGGCGDPDDDAELAPAGEGWTGKLRVTRGDQVLSNRRCGPKPPLRVPDPPTVRAAAEGSRGSARYGDHAVEWGPGRATVTGPAGAKVTLFEDREERGDGFVAQYTHRLLSVVGPYVSYSIDYYGEGGAHPSYGTTWDVVDMRDKDADVDLRRLFEPRALYTALMADKALTRALRGAQPADLPAFLDALDGGCTMALGPEMLGAFAFQRLDGDRVAVRLGIGHGCEVERGTFNEIELLLPIGELMPMLVPADAAGTLREDQPTP